MKTAKRQRSLLGGCSDPQEAEWCLSSGRELVYFDPQLPDDVLRDCFERYLMALRKRHTVAKTKMRLWAKNRVLALHKLILGGYEPPRTSEFDIAAWIFPEEENAKARWKLLKKTEELLREALASIPYLEAQARL